MSRMKNVAEFLYGVQKKKQDLDGTTKLEGPVHDRKNVLDLKILVAVDISGSISADQYKQFMQQIEKIKGLSVVKVLETDTSVQAFYTYKKGRSGAIRLQGGGGTEFSKAFVKIKEVQPDAVLFMTDGFVGGPSKNPGVPVGWVLTSNGRKPFQFGEVVVQLP